MSDLLDAAMPNISEYYNNTGSSGTQKVDNWWSLPDDSYGLKTSEKSNTDLTFEDMLLLMVTQLQNQTIDNQADTNDMMNQMIQMTVMQAITEMSAQVEDLTNANIMSYSASLVGKTVTVGILDPRTGALTGEIVGEVTATGTYNGQQVIFIGDKYFPLSSIMAVGTLPETAVDGTDTTIKPDDGENEDKVDGSGEAGDDEKLPVEDETDENEPVKATGGNQDSKDEPTLPVEDDDGGMDAAARVNGNEAI